MPRNLGFLVLALSLSASYPIPGAAQQRPLSPFVFTPDEIRLQRAVNEANSKCRGTPGASPTGSLCKQRDALFRQALRRGLCYDSPTGIGADNMWVRCSPR